MIQVLRRTTLGFVFLVAGLLSIGLSPSWGQSSLAVPGTVSGNLPALTSVNTYTVTVPVDGDVTFTVTNSSALDTVVQFYDTDGKTELGEVIPIGNGTSGSFTVTHLGPGATYYVVVYVWEGSGTYTLSDTESYPPDAINKEPNDTPKEALPLTVGQTVTGHVGYSRASYTTQDNVDYYKFTVPVDGDVTISITPSSALTQLETLVQFWDIDGKTQIGDIVTGGISANGSFTVPHLGPGATYYVSVSTWANYGSYQLTSSETLPLYAKSITPNSTVKRAIAMGIGTPAKPDMKAGLIGYSTRSYNTTDSVDYYKVTPTTDGDLTISITPSSILEALVQFYDSNGTSVISDVVTGGNGANDSFTVPHLGPGATYYISVSVWANYGSYQLSTSLARPKEKSQKEPDGSFAQAHPLALNKTTTGLLGYSTTSYNTVDIADYFSVPGNPGTLAVTVATESTLSALVQVWDGSGNQLASFITGNGASGQTSVALQSGGSYYVSVTIWSGYGGYTLKNTFH